jgi:hypothetical protein
MREENSMNQSDRRPELGSANGPKPPGMPRWVKASAAVVALLVVALVAVLIMTGGQHGPGRHANMTSSVSG